MKIAIISDWYSEGMGYSENQLPKALASLGHEVHLITTTAQVYFNSPDYNQMYESFLGPPIVDCVTKKLDGYVLHRLPFKRWGKNRLIQILNLRDTLREIKPHIVQVLDVSCLSTFQTALNLKSLGCKLFGESHIHASVFLSDDQKKMPLNNLKWSIFKNTIGRFNNARLTKCYPISTDSAAIAEEYFGIDREKTQVCSLGVDTELFEPVDGTSAHQIRTSIRSKLGFKPSDIVCIYTGRLREDKNPLCLAKAVDVLVKEKRPFRGLFVGNGSQNHVSLIKKCRGCVVHPFVPMTELNKFYWASDIGVWPKQESTSQLDAAACGLPLVLSDRIMVFERVRGNGILYHEDDYCDLAEKLVSLEDSTVRKSLGSVGSEKVLREYSWKAIAMRRVEAYKSQGTANIAE